MENELMHYRTKGSKNGVRRYQYKDGSWTPLGLKRRRSGMVDRLYDKRTESYRKTAEDYRHESRYYSGARAKELKRNADTFEDIADKRDKYSDDPRYDVRQYANSLTKQHAKLVGNPEVNRKALDRIDRAYKFLDKHPEIVNSYAFDNRNLVTVGTLFGGPFMGITYGLLNVRKYHKKYPDLA